MLCSYLPAVKETFRQLRSHCSLILLSKNCGLMWLLDRVPHDFQETGCYQEGKGRQQDLDGAVKRRPLAQEES